jgi:hypothetical protein
MTRSEARIDVNAHLRKLDQSLDDARSQFSVRICYVAAHSDLVELTRRIISELTTG